MLATTALAQLHARFAWHWCTIALLPFGVVLLTIDGAFFSAHILKISSGGGFPQLLGAVMHLLMTTWHSARGILIQHMNRDGLDLKAFVTGLVAHPPHRVDGTAVFLTARSSGVPYSLLHRLKHNLILHRMNIVLTLAFLDVPFVQASDRVGYLSLGDGFYQVQLRLGFAEDTDLPAVLGAI